MTFLPYSLRYQKARAVPITSGRITQQEHLPDAYHILLSKMVC
jgi:hypothetical protein